MFNGRLGHRTGTSWSRFDLEITEGSRSVQVLRVCSCRFAKTGPVQDSGLLVVQGRKANETLMFTRNQPVVAVVYYIKT